MIEKYFLEQLDQWHEEEKHQEIADAITDLPPEDREYEVVNRLGRALNDLEEYDEAIKHLLSVKEEGEEDPLWHFRMGYAYFYLDQEGKALQEFERVCELNPYDEDAWLYLLQCSEILGVPSRLEIPDEIRDIAEEASSESQADYNPELYDEEDLDAVETHIEKYFGSYSSVFHELISPDIHVDICVVEPTPERNYYTLITLGMGAHSMKVPPELEEDDLERAELLICLPPDWNMKSNEEKWYWPLRWLKILARLPGQEDSWLGFGHTVPNGEPFADNTKLSGVMLVMPGGFDDAAKACTLPKGKDVNFYQVIPLYDEEMEYKVAEGAEALLEIFSDSALAVVDVSRPNFAALRKGKNKKLN